MTSINDFKVTRLPGGLSTNEIQQNMGQYPLPDITKVHQFFDDFNVLSTDYVLTETQAGATQTIQDADGGVLLLANTAGPTDLISMQLNAEIFQFELGKQLWFKSIFKVSDATESEVAVGLQIRNTTPFTAVTDGVFFRKSDGSTTLQLVVVQDSIETVTDVLEMADDTYVTVGFYYNGDDKISIFSDNEGAGKSVTANLPDDEALAPLFAVKNGEAVAKDLSIDYLFVSKAR